MMRIIGGKLCGVCPDCAKIVRLQKPIFGSLHICTTDDERTRYGAAIAQMVREAERQLAEASSGKSVETGMADENPQFNQR